MAATDGLPVRSSEGVGSDSEARAFFAALARVMRDGAKEGVGPARVVVAIDGLEQLTPEEAISLLQAARRLLQVPGFVTILAAERMHLAAGLDETDPALVTAWLNRMVQLPVTLDLEGEAWPDASAFVHGLLQDPSASAPPEQPASMDAAVSTLDRAWTSAEGSVLEALAPWSGNTPRAVKRFVNLYRVARADPRMRGARAEEFASLALALALQSTGPVLDAGLTIDPESRDRARDARQALTAALNKPLGPADDDRSYAVARTYRAGH